ncbi:UvrD-helicase domain-containing protein [Roseateles sp.]|uniref:UvrD-helicase domain-containing protein n=1 Tax=Roseateles sp. TaxID=1971397 RepID=UPI003D151849
MTKAFKPTDEQKKVITFDGSAFVTACPGAGKTRVLIERARHLLATKDWKRGIAFLSFTDVAVSELDARLRREGILPTPVMPHFIGTFDSFLWRVLVAPFGIPGSLARPRLIPDLELREVQPYEGARPIPLNCFNRVTGEAIADKLRELKIESVSKAHVTTAKKMRARFKERGELDYQDARLVALGRLKALNNESPLTKSLVARFGEIIVDEAQDCNPDDLGIIEWFLGAGIPVKVICDPNQSIYGFRGGVSTELDAFATKFGDDRRLSLTGNFRSSKHIVAAVSRLKRPETGRSRDEALGEHQGEPSPVYLLAYKGQSVPASVGTHFGSLVTNLKIAAKECPVVAATRLSASRALGLPVDSGSGHLACRLAAAVGDLFSSFELGGRQEALEQMHRVVLTLEGHLTLKTYRQHMDALGDKHQAWRPEMLRLCKQLRYDQETHKDSDGWLYAAREILKERLPSGGDRSINQVLRRHEKLAEALVPPPLHGHSARTIHSVKGAEFPAVCVVLSPQRAKSTIEHLETGANDRMAEELRKLYVGASRAQRLLAIATPHTQVKKLERLLSSPNNSGGLRVVDL